MAKFKVNSEIGSVSLTPKEIVQFIECAIDANQSVFLWGPPGVAKSALVKKVAKKRGIGLVDFRALMRDVVDLNGIPTVSEDGRYTKWLRPSWLPEEGNPQFEDKGIFFIDELNAAPPSMQAVCYQLVHDRMAGEHILHPGWIPIGAGNNDTDGAVTSRMPTPLKSRFVHGEIKMTEEINGVRKLENQSQWCDEWLEWGRDEGGIHPLVIAYHRFFGGADLYAFNKTARTFPCLRTWEFVSNILKSKVSGNMLFPMLSGAIGEGHAAKVYAFIQEAAELPDIEEVLKNPTTIPIPTDGGRKYALVCALSAKLLGMDGKEFSKQFPQAMKFTERLDADFQVCVVEDVYKGGKKTEVMKQKAFQEWVCGPVGALVASVREMDK